jgi:hypothetical protein
VGGSQTSVGLPPDSSRPLMHVRSNTQVHAADRVAEFPRGGWRGRIGDQARAHRRSGAGASAIGRGCIGDRARVHRRSGAGASAIRRERMGTQGNHISWPGAFSWRVMRSLSGRDAESLDRSR